MQDNISLKMGVAEDRSILINKEVFTMSCGRGFSRGGRRGGGVGTGGRSSTRWHLVGLSFFFFCVTEHALDKWGKFIGQLFRGRGEKCAV